MLNRPSPCSIPVTKKIKKTITQLGHTRTDDYAWLKDKNWQSVMADPSVLQADIRESLETENAYVEAVLFPTQDLQAQIFAEFKGRIKDDDGSVPAPDGPYAYAHKYRPGDEHGVYYRTLRAGGEDEIILDADALAKLTKAEGQAYFDLSAISHSDHHQYLAYGLDGQGSEQYRITVIDIATGLPIGEPISGTTGDFVWAADNETLFWVERDESNRPKTIYSKNIIQGGEKHLVYDETDPGFFVSVGRSDSHKLITLVSNNHTTTEIRTIPAQTPSTPPKLVSSRQNGHEYDILDHQNDFYILTNMDGATDFQIMKCAQNNCAIEHWDLFEPHQPGRLILGLETYADHLVWMERIDALPRIIVHKLSTNERHIIDFDEDAYALGLISGYEFNTQIMRFSYSSPTTPHQVYDYNMDTRDLILRKTVEIPSGHNPDNYKTKRIGIKARDGETIPVTLITRSDFKQNGQAPCLLYGYGSYGITIPASFRSAILSLIDRGFVYAIAHIRGSKAKGYDWYQNGKLAHKANTFNDFVDVGTSLVEQNYTHRGNIIAHGGSAGGLLVGAALNQAPDLFGGVIAAVPFVDVLNTMSDDSLPLTPPEWPEWGNPITDETAYNNIAQYCPYTNIQKRDYPPVLITAGLTDPRVTYWEPAKWAAKLREHQTGDAPIFLKTHMDAGHQGESGRYASLKDLALEYAFAVTITR